MEKVKIEVTIEDWYGIINAMRDRCGCEECMRITTEMMIQRKAQK